MFTPFSHFRASLVAALLIQATGLPCRALEVFINTNAPAKSSDGSQLFDRDAWKRAAEEIDGIWYVGQGMSKPPDGQSSIAKARDQWIEGLKDKRWIIEMKQESAAAMAGEKKHVVHEVKAMKDAGIARFSAMVWSSKHNKDSTIPASEVKEVREGLKAAGAPDAKIIVNTRAFHRNHLLQELVKKDQVDGFSIEIPSHGVRQGKILEHEVGDAIEFAVRHQKDVYVLVNAEHSKTFLDDIQDIFTRLRRSAGHAMSSPHVRIVLSSYSNGKTQFTPERHGNDAANTVTGAAVWLCAEADRHHLRDGRGKAAAQR